jgi:hypothetical protein
MDHMKIGYAAPLALLVLAGCFSYSSTETRTVPPPVAVPAPAPVCVYGGRTYSPGARITSATGAAIECRADGNWSRF